MQTTRIVQAVILMMIVAVAASCAASKEYTSKLFTPRIPVIKDSSPAVALKFLELDSLENEKEGWVKTDIIKGNDTSSQTLLLDKLAKTIPVAADTILNNKEEKTIPVPADPLVKNGSTGEIRTKRTRE